MQTITVHRPGCPQISADSDGLHVVTKDLDTLAAEIYRLMEKYNLPFYCVEPHSSDCPGRYFPWEDLEFKLFILAH